MSEAGTPPPERPAVLAPLRAPRSPRLRARLVTLLLVGVLWVLPWFGGEPGAAHAGAPGALALALAWGLAATLSSARTREGIALGEAATSFSVTALAAVLAGAGHSWLRGGEGASSLVPIFAPLALLCALDAGLRVARPGAGREVTWLRAGSAGLAGASLLAAQRTVPAAAALVAALLPAAAQLPRSLPRARRALEGASLVAAAGLFLAPEAHRAATGAAESVESATVWAFAFRVLSLVLGGIAAVGAFAAAHDDPAPTPAPATTR